jgi:hypothetical protein
MLNALAAKSRSVTKRSIRREKWIRMLPAPTLPNEFEWSINEGAKLPPPIVDLPQSPSEALSFAPEQPIPNFSSTTSLPVYPQASDLSGSSFTFEEFPKFEETMIIESQPVTPHSHDY